MNSYTKRGGAARRRFCVICKKPEGGGNQPPGCARVNISNLPSLEACNKDESKYVDWSKVTNDDIALYKDATDCYL